MKREERFVNRIHTLGLIRWFSGLYLVMLLFSCVVFALNMNYSQVLSGQLLMTICESFMIGAFSFVYGVWAVFPYIWIKGKDGRMAQDLIESICWMPCDPEEFFDVIFYKLWKKMKVTGIVIFLILAAGMFVGPYTGEQAGTGIGLQLPRHMVLSVSVCVIGTAWVLFWMLMGWFFTRQFRLKIYYRKRNGQRTKGKLLRGNKKKGVKRRTLLSHWSIECMIIILWFVFVYCLYDSLSPIHEQGIGICNYMWDNNFIMAFTGIMCADAIALQIENALHKEKVKWKSVVLLLLLAFACLFGNGTSYQCYYEDSIETSILARKQSYTWEDVVTYRVYATYFWGDTVLEMKTEDGKTLKIHTGNMEVSEAFWYSYEDEDEYIADIVEKLAGFGVEGTMEDEQKLRKHGDEQSILRISRYTKG